MQQYTRRSQPGWDPNDRGYDRELEEKIKRMNPSELDLLLHGDLGDQDEQE